MPNTINVTLGGAAVNGAVVTVTMPGLIAGIGGYNAIATTNSSGNANFPNGPDFFGGSSADVSASYTDASGTTYTGLGEWGLNTFGGWNPNPLKVTLSTSGQSASATQAQQNQEKTTSKPSSVFGGIFEGVTDIEWIIIAIVVIIIIGVIAYSLAGGDLTSSASKSARKAVSYVKAKVNEATSK